ncbi:twin-arginine translocation signal domain-containing protein [Streptomyces lannensis]|uniref:twin-arginine translocation signal domain-containing protein n=1 Tax=Streptomyces lannensis TaxID=766498 RepID=UPI003CD05DB9
MTSSESSRLSRRTLLRTTAVAGAAAAATTVIGPGTASAAPAMSPGPITISRLPERRSRGPSRPLRSTSELRSEPKASWPNGTRWSRTSS